MIEKFFNKIGCTTKSNKHYLISVLEQDDIPVELDEREITVANIIVEILTFIFGAGLFFLFLYLN